MLIGFLCVGSAYIDIYVLICIFYFLFIYVLIED